MEYYLSISPELFEDTFEREIEESYDNPIDWPYIEDLSLDSILILVGSSIVNPRILSGLELNYPDRYDELLSRISLDVRGTRMERSKMTDDMDSRLYCQLINELPYMDLFEVAGTESQCGLEALNHTFEVIVETLPDCISDLTLDDISPLLYWDSKFDKREELIEALRDKYDGGDIGVASNIQVLSVLIKYKVLSSKAYAKLLAMGYSL